MDTEDALRFQEGRVRSLLEDNTALRVQNEALKEEVEYLGQRLIESGPQYTMTNAGIIRESEAPTRDQVEAALEHDPWCGKSGEHQDCCPGRAEFDCRCIVWEHINVLTRNGWLRVR